MTTESMNIVFCDDIREEVGSKRSLMGIYQAEMFVSAMPIMLPKLCAFVTLTFPNQKEISKIEVKIVRGSNKEELLTTGTFSPQQPTNSELGDLGIPFSSKTIALALVLSPFSIESETTLQVLAEVDDSQITSQPLRIRLAPSQ